MKSPTLDKAKSPRPRSFNKRDDIVNEVYKLAERDGYESLTRDNIAEAAGIAFGSITYYFTTVQNLREQIMKKAIVKKNLVILAAGIAARSEQALAAPERLKQEAVKLLY